MAILLDKFWKMHIIGKMDTKVENWLLYEFEYPFPIICTIEARKIQEKWDGSCVTQSQQSSLYDLVLTECRVLDDRGFLDYKDLYVCLAISSQIYGICSALLLWSDSYYDASSSLYLQFTAKYLFLLTLLLVSQLFSWYPLKLVQVFLILSTNCVF